jgi:hypothetical protein
MTCGRLYLYDTLLEGLVQDFQDGACALEPFIQEEYAMVRPRHFPGPRHLAAAGQAHIRDGVLGARQGRVVTNAVRSPLGTPRGLHRGRAHFTRRMGHWARMPTL